MRLVVNATGYGEIPGGAGLRARSLFGALLGRGGGEEVLFLLAEETPERIVPAGAQSRRLKVSCRARAGRRSAIRSLETGDLLFCDHFPIHPRIPTVLTLHDRGLGVWRRMAVRNQARKAAAVVAVSRTVERAWPTLRAEVIPNGVDLPVGEPPPPGAHLLVCDPGLPHKGAALAREVARRTGRPLREVGRGVRWLGHEALQRELAAAGVVLCPSIDEGFGLVPLEALALGRPVVASDIPAHREVLGSAAALVDPRDVEGWCKAVERASDADPAPGVDRAREYGWDAAAERLAGLVARLAAGHERVAEVDQPGEDGDQCQHGEKPRRRR